MSRLFTIISIIIFLIIGLLCWLTIAIMNTPNSVNRESSSFPDIYLKSPIKGFHSAQLDIFRIDIPTYVKYEIKNECMDCLYGSFTSNQYIINLDFGGFNDYFERLDPTTHYVSLDTINDIPAKVILPLDSSNYNAFIGVYFKNWDNNQNLTISLNRWTNLDTASLILSSIRKMARFKPKNQIGLNKTEVSMGMMTGKGLFKMNCQACHDIDSDMTGPALSTSFKKHDSSWIKIFVNDSENIHSKAEIDSLKGTYVGYWRHRYDLSEKDIEALKNYVMNRTY